LIWNLQADAEEKEAFAPPAIEENRRPLSKGSVLSLIDETKGAPEFVSTVLE